MITPRANVHRSKLPPPGAVGRIVGLPTINPRRKCIVVAYPSLLKKGLPIKAY